LKNALDGYIQLSVSRAFFDEAQQMIKDEMWDQAIITLRNEPLSPTWFCFQDKQKNEDGDYILNGNSEIFAKLPRITLVPNEMLDKYRELEKATGFRMKDIGAKEYSDTYFRFMEGDFKGIPHFDNCRMQALWETIKPQSYDDVLKIIGFAHSTNVWKDNAEYLYAEHRLSLSEIPAFREDVYEMICDRLSRKGLCDKGLAYEVMEKARRGAYAREGVDDDTILAMLNLGFNQNFLFFLEKVNYMFTKSNGISYLHEAIVMMHYRIKYEKEYNMIM
jgi:hypothetical protein